jgi:hypothetical protein
LASFRGSRTLSNLKRRMALNFSVAYARDRRFISQLDVRTLDRIILPLFIGFICINFLDLYTTTLALNFGPLFHEHNPIAAALFSNQFQGFLLATALKYLPIMPFFYGVFLKDSKESAFQVRLVKFSCLVALAAADIFLLYIVALNNVPALLGASLR